MESLANQTDRRFRVYIGDDASLEPLGDIIATFTRRMDVRYTRFDTNLGGTSLVAHWHRCIALSQSEPWIWLFSDDDIADSECVAAFYELVGSAMESSVDLLRFQLDRIDEFSQRTRPWKDHPPRETTEAFLGALLTDTRRAVRAQEHIFSRRVFDRCGGFVNFPRAIYSDHATWLRFSEPYGVRTIPGPRVKWRSHAAGTTTGQRGTNRSAWLEAAALYLRWLEVFSRRHDPSFAIVFKRGGFHFFVRALSQFRPTLSPAERSSAAKVAHDLFGVGPRRLYLELQLQRVRSRLKHVL